MTTPDRSWVLNFIIGGLQAGTQKAAILEDRGLHVLRNLMYRRRFPPLVLPRSGSCNIDYLFEYSERNGLHYACPSLRWHYPDQVQPVGGEIGHPLSLASPSSPGEQD